MVKIVVRQKDLVDVYHKNEKNGLFFKQDRLYFYIYSTGEWLGMCLQYPHSKYKK